MLQAGSIMEHHLYNQATRRQLLLGTSAVLTGLCIGGPALAAPGLTENQEGPLSTSALAKKKRGQLSGIDIFDELLKTYVTPDGVVDYTTLQQKGMGDLDHVLNWVARRQTLKDVNHRRAFNINAYNALCLRLMIDEHVPAKVPHGGFFSSNLFSMKRYQVGGVKRSLNEIEQEVFRNRHPDPRICATLFRGNLTSAPLRRGAYRADALGIQLSEAARRWLTASVPGKPKKRLGFYHEPSHTYYAPGLMERLSDDFGGEAGIRRFILRAAPLHEQRQLKKDTFALKYLDENWKTNRA
jgi:hypothetical protein